MSDGVRIHPIEAREVLACWDDHSQHYEVRQTLAY